jgi:hypothetical protein
VVVVSVGGTRRRAHLEIGWKTMGQIENEVVVVVRRDVWSFV